MSGASTIKWTVKRGLGRLSEALRLGRRPAGVRCLAYHRITRDVQQDAAQMATPFALFEEQMAWLAAEGFRVVDALSVVKQLRAGEAPPPRTMALTIDDGFAETADLLVPVLRRHRFSATLFVMTAALDGAAVHNGYAERYLRWGHAAELSASGHVRIGCHSATHRLLAGLPEAALQREITDAKARLEDRLRCAVPLFAYPFGAFGAWDGRTRAAVMRAGFLGAFTSIAGTNTPRTDPYGLRRLRVSWCERLPEFGRVLNGAYDWYAMVQRVQSWRRPLVSLASWTGGA